jgi:hypothetical protein
MKGLTTPDLGRACDIFLTHAYAGEEAAIPPNRLCYLHIAPNTPLDTLLTPPVCQPLRKPEGQLRGYAWRLGSPHYPHLKLHAVLAEGDACVFMVDTHDSMQLDPSHPDAQRWSQIQLANRQLKERIERAWEDAGLLTFNGLLRRKLNQA